jgi:predicted ATPase
MMLGCSLWMLGYPDRGSRIVRSAVDLTRQLNHYPSEAYAQASTLLLHHYQWDVTRAEQTVNRLLTLARQESFEIWTPFALMFQGWTMAEKGDGDGIALTRRGLDQWRATGSYLNQTIISGMLATSLRKVGRIDEALDVLSSEIVASAQREELHFAPELHRLRGEILLERGRCVEGEAELECARDLARGQHALMLELRALTSLCRVWAATGRSQLAVGSLSSLYGKLTEGFSTPDASAARVLLQELQAPNESIHEPAGLLPP